MREVINVLKMHIFAKHLGMYKFPLIAAAFCFFSCDIQDPLASNAILLGIRIRASLFSWAWAWKQEQEIMQETW